ncbi:MAG: MFS transporter [Candidatus Sungbacteria bacterium]|nr:MFS transporter [Candidatus Sungbacteria bacterium]
MLLGFSALFFQLSSFSIIAIAAALIFYGIVIELVLIPGDAELMSLSPRRRSGRFFGIYESAHNFGYAMGPFIGGFLIWYTPPPVFWTLIILCAILAIWAFFFKSKKVESGEPLIRAARSVIKRDHYLVGSVREFSSLGFQGWMLWVFFFAFAFRWGAIALLLPLFALDLNLHPVWVGLIYSASTLPFIFFSAPAGYLSDKYGVKPFIAGGLGIAGVATFLFGAFDSAIILFVLSFIAAIGDSFLVPTVYASFDTLASRHFKGRVTSVVAVAEDTGYLFGPLLAGSIAQYFGFPAAFYTLGIIILSAAAVAVVIKLQ